MITFILREVVELICEYYSVNESDLHVRSQKRLLSKIRLMTARLVIRFKIASLMEIATYFNRDVSTFSRGLSRMPESDDVEFDALRRYMKVQLCKPDPAFDPAFKIF